MGEKEKNFRKKISFYFLLPELSLERDSKTPYRYMHEPPSELSEEQERDVLVRSIEV